MKRMMAALAGVAMLSLYAGVGSHMISSDDGDRKHHDGRTETARRLRAIFKDALSIKSGKAPRVEYCPDNTCEAFSSRSAAATTDVTDFALAYLLFVSGYWTLPEIRSTDEGKTATEAVLVRARDLGCARGHDRDAAKCLLRALEKRSQVRLSFVRYDEKKRIEQSLNLEEELARVK